MESQLSANCLFTRHLNSIDQTELCECYYDQCVHLNNTTSLLYINSQL